MSPHFNFDGNHDYKSCGFTLLEMLLALVVTGMLVALLTGALFYVLQVREKLTTELVNGGTDVNTQVWFQTVVAGALPVKEGGLGTFSGRAHSMRMLTQGGLLPSGAGAPEEVELALDHDANGVLRLIYREGESEFLLAEWPSGEGEFVFYDSKGEVASEWKVRPNVRLGLLPRTVALNVVQGQQSKRFVATVRTDGWLEPEVKLPFDVDEVTR